MSRKEDRRRAAIARRFSGSGKRAGSKKGYHKGCFGSAPEHGHYPPYKIQEGVDARMASGGVPRHIGGKVNG